MTSPDARGAAAAAAAAAAKRTPLTNAPALAKSASESALKKKQQGSLLDQELLLLERDEGKRHAREFSSCLLDYAKKIEELQEKNRRLEQELSFDDNVARNDPFLNDQVAEKLSNLYLQGNNFMIRLELEKKEIARLNALIQRHESTLAQQKTKLYELAALDQNHATLIGKVRKLENDIDRRIVKMNERLYMNRKLRETIDAHRAERARMDAIYAKISSEALSKRAKVARATAEVEKLRQEVAGVEQQIEDIRQEGEEWEIKCDEKAASLLRELKEVALHQKDAEELIDADKHKYLGENDIVRNMVASQENALRSQVEHFDRIQHVNQLAEDIENYRQVSAKLREEIGRLKQRKDSVDFQRMNRIEGLKSRLQFTIDQKKHKEEANHNLQEFAAVLRPSILLLHSRIGCAEVHNDSDMKKILGEIEEQIVTVLQNFHVKTEAKMKEEASRDGSLPGSTGSISGRRGSLTMKNRAESTSLAAPADVSTSSTASTAESNQNAAIPSTTATDGADSQVSLNNQRAGAEQLQLPSKFKTASAFTSKYQPYRYGGLRPPHLSLEELKKKDNMEEEYPLTYDELKSKVWHTDAAQ